MDVNIVRKTQLLDNDTHSDDFVSYLEDGDLSKAGILLAKLCVEANLPSKYVVIALYVSRVQFTQFKVRSYKVEVNITLIKTKISLYEQFLKG